MIVTLLGVRGSRPISMMNTLRYGGNTTCFKIEVHNTPPIFIDGGTGLYDEGVRMMEENSPKNIHFLITHTHWDHLLSFPYFGPLYEKGRKIFFYAPVSQNRHFMDLIQGQHNPRAFPVPYDALEASQEFIDTKPGDSFNIKKVKIRSYQLNHPGTTLGWRLETNNASVAIITDNAPIEDNYLGEGMQEIADKDPRKFEQDFNDGLVEFIKDTDLVIFDTHFDEHNIENRRHWGHSTPSMAIEFCLKANAKRLILHHHAPEDTDEETEQKAEKARALVQDSDLQVEAGSEGMKIWL